jgi:hypothetical protein
MQNYIKDIICMIDRSDVNIDKKTRFLIYDLKDILKIKNQNRKIIFDNNLDIINEFFNKKDKNLLEKERETFLLELQKEIYGEKNSQVNN